MRYLVIAALLSTPVYAQAPGRQIAYKCDEDVCVMSRADWEWMMGQYTAAQKLLAKCGWKNS